MNRIIDLTQEEQDHVRAALQFLRHRLGWPSLAKTLHYSQWNMRKFGRGARKITPVLAFRVARLAQVAVDDVLTGKWPAPGTCPSCGHHDERKVAK